MIRAPGKLFLTGAWAVLEGAPAIVVAVDRFARAELEGEPSSMPEVVAVARRLDAPPPNVDVSEMLQNGSKIGVGSSAAASVAAAAAILHARHGSIDLERVIDVASRAHRDVQPRGSGADVAASAHGGTIEVRRVDDRLLVERRSLPSALVWRAFTLSKPTSTRDALDRFAARRTDERVDYAVRSLFDAAVVGATAVREGDLVGFLEAARAHVAALEHLGAALDLPLVPFEVFLARDLLLDPQGNTEMQASPVLFPSGAGGGDTVVWLGARAPTDQEVRALEERGLVAVELSLSTRGVHAEPSIGTADAERI